MDLERFRERRRASMPIVVATLDERVGLHRCAFDAARAFMAARGRLHVPITVDFDSTPCMLFFDWLVSTAYDPYTRVYKGADIVTAPFDKKLVGELRYLTVLLVPKGAAQEEIEASIASM